MHKKSKAIQKIRSNGQQCRCIPGSRYSIFKTKIFHHVLCYPNIGLSFKFLFPLSNYGMFTLSNYGVCRAAPTNLEREQGSINLGLSMTSLETSCALGDWLPFWSEKPASAFQEGDPKFCLSTQEKIARNGITCSYPDTRYQPSITVCFDKRVTQRKGKFSWHSFPQLKRT